MNTTDARISIQAAMRDAFPQAEARVARFYQMQEYQLGWRDPQLGTANEDPGKLLRPRLALMACRAAGGDPARALPLAAAIQLIHDFSLIHDDIEDNSDMRRGRPTVWTLWGLAQGINTGDGMFVVAHLAVHRLTEMGVAPEVVLEVLKRFDQTILTICEGQFLDLSYEGNLAISEEDYLAMIGRKTAALVAAAAGLGAIIGGADVSTARALFDFGEHIGLAFQIQDDVLGIWGDPEVTGKPFAADIYRRKLSLPVVRTLATTAARADLVAIYQRATLTDSDVRRTLDILDDVGARGYTEGVAAYHHSRALAALDAVSAGDPAAITSMRAIAEGLVDRQK